MLDFPIDEIYRRIARFDVIDEDKNIPVGSGSGFFYLYNDRIFFATSREYVIVEEKAFLPDLITLYLNTDKGSEKIKITLPLYDTAEKPVWQVFMQEQDKIFVSIPIPRIIPELDFTCCFLSLYHLPSRVCLQADDITLTIPVSVCTSLAGYFFHSNLHQGDTLQKRIEEHGDFKINRRGFATDMVEMVLVLLQHNLDATSEAKKKNMKEEISNYFIIHDNLINELEKIIIQFGDVLDLTIYDKIQKIFSILKDNNLEDYIIARHLIRKVLMLLGQNILFAQ